MKVLRSVSLLSASVAVICAAGMPSFAGYEGHFNKNDVQIRSSPSGSATLLGHGQKGNWTCVAYSVNGTSVGGSKVWYYRFSGGPEGFSPAVRINLVTPAGKCAKV